MEPSLPQISLALTRIADRCTRISSITIVNFTGPRADDQLDAGIILNYQSR